MNKCGRCGRVLKTEESRQRGYGPVCWAKVQEAQQNKNDLLQQVASF